MAFFQNFHFYQNSLIIIPNVQTDIGVIFALLKQSPESTGIISKQWKERVLPPDPWVQVSDDQTKMKKVFSQYDTQGDNLHT